MHMYNLLEYSKIIRKQHVVYGIIIEINQVILFQLILNLLNTRQALQEVLTMLMMMMTMMIMMQIKLVKKKLKLLFHENI